MYINKKVSASLVALMLASPAISFAGGSDDSLRSELSEQRKMLEKQISQVKKLEKKIANMGGEATTTGNPAVTLGGSFAFNYRYRDYNEGEKDKNGVVKWNKFVLNLKANIDDIGFVGQYRYYPTSADSHFVSRAYATYAFTDNLNGEFGLTKVPFGLLGYASHNWWGSIGYYIGQEDDNDIGAKLIYNEGPVNIQAAFFKNGDVGSSSNLRRYSYDLSTAGCTATANEQCNELTNQGNLRIVYNLADGDLNAEIGISGEYGGVYNTHTDKTGSHKAYAAHLDLGYKGLNLQLQAAKYKYDFENAAGRPTNVAYFGAFGYGHAAPAEANMYHANISYDIPVNLGKIETITVYNDYSTIRGGDSVEPGVVNTTGFSFGVGPIYAYVDFVQGQNASYIGAANDTALGTKDSVENKRETLFNINIGYYF